jgi:hypothetical protein
MWPYITQQGFRDFFWIVDAFNYQVLYRIFIPGEDFMLLDFFIYEFKIYFIQFS